MAELYVCACVRVCVHVCVIIVIFCPSKESGFALVFVKYTCV